MEDLALLLLRPEGFADNGEGAGENTVIEKAKGVCAAAELRGAAAAKKKCDCFESV